MKVDHQDDDALGQIMSLRDDARGNKRFDYCTFQSEVNDLGGDEFSPAFLEYPDAPGDNLTYYGFKHWMKHATYSYIDDDFKLPTFSGVYAVTCIYPGPPFSRPMLGWLHVLYVGSAKNIAERVSHADHWYQRALRHFKKKRPFSVGLYVLPTTDYKIYEKSLIRSLRPLFNIHHRG